jgi:hypothetical protein
MKPCIVPFQITPATRDEDIPTVLLDDGQESRRRSGTEFYMVTRDGLETIGATLGWHGPSMLAVMEAARSESVKRRGGFRLSWAWAERAGLTKWQLREVRRVLSGAPTWVTVEDGGRGATVLTLTRAAREALEYRRN